MNHTRVNAGVVETTGSGDVPEWEGLRQEKQLRSALNRWNSRDDVHFSAVPATKSHRERKIVGRGKRNKPENVEGCPTIVTTPKSAEDENLRHAEPVRGAASHVISRPHLVGKPNMSPRKMHSTGFLYVPSLNVAKQRSLRQPNDNGQRVARSKSDQGQSSPKNPRLNIGNTSGLRKSVAKRGLSVRRLPSSDSAAKRGLSVRHLNSNIDPAERGLSVRNLSSNDTAQRSGHSERSFRIGSKRAIAPEPTLSFVSATISVESNLLGSLDEEEFQDSSGHTGSPSPSFSWENIVDSTKEDAVALHAPGPAPSPLSPLERKGISPRPLPPAVSGTNRGELTTPPKRGSSDFQNQKEVMLTLTRHNSPCMSPKLHVVRRLGSVELQKKSPPIDLPPGALSSSLHSSSTNRQPSQRKHVVPGTQRGRTSPPTEFVLDGSNAPPKRRHSVSPMRSTRSTRSVNKAQNNTMLRNGSSRSPVRSLTLAAQRQNVLSEQSRTSPPAEPVANISFSSPETRKHSVSPMRSTRSSRSLSRTPSKTKFRTGSSKSPVPNRSGKRPSMSQRLMSFRSIVSVNTNVAVSGELYPNKLKRQQSAGGALSRESSDEYGAKAVQRKSLLTRLGGSLRATGGFGLDDDVTRTSAEDDTFDVENEEKDRKVAGRPLVANPDRGTLVQKQQERRTLLARMSQRDRDDKTETTSVSKLAKEKDLCADEEYEGMQRQQYIPEFIYFREFSPIHDDDDDNASAITEAFTLCEGEVEGGVDSLLDDFAPIDKSVELDGLLLEVELKSQPSTSDDKSAQKKSVVDACATLLANDDPYLVDNEAEQFPTTVLAADEQTLWEKEQENIRLIDSLLNASPPRAANIPRLKSLRAKTVWQVEEDSDGSLYVDNPEHVNVEAAQKEDDAYASEVLEELEKAKPAESCPTLAKKKIKKKKLRRVETSDRVLIEL